MESQWGNQYFNIEIVKPLLRKVFKYNPPNHGMLYFMIWGDLFH